MTTTLVDARPQALYRFYDEFGSLLYVGISVSPIARLHQHRSDSPWWSLARTMTIEPFATRGEVQDAERSAIQAESPIYNVHRGMVKRTVFVPEKLWDEAKALADEAESNISTVVRELLERYVKRGGKR